MTGPMLTVRQHLDRALEMLKPGSAWELYHVRDQLLRVREVLDNSREITEKITDTIQHPFEGRVTFVVSSHKARVVWDD